MGIRRGEKSGVSQDVWRKFSNERAPLITERYQSYSERGLIAPPIVEPVEEKERLPRWFVSEFCHVFNLAWSLFLITLFNFLLEPVALYFCGRLGSNELAAVALAISVLNISGVAVGMGLATACDTVFSQSMGSENKTEAGVYLIKGCIIILLFIFPCMAIHLNMEAILLAMGQPDCVARLAGEYMLHFTCSLPAVFLGEILMQYLRCQDILVAPLVIGFTSVAVCALAHYVLVTVLEYGLRGSAFALGFSFYVQATLLVLYTICSGIYKKTWRGWTKDSFQGWGEFLKLAMAGFVMLAVEWWVWEFSVVTSGWIGITELGVASIILNILTIDFQLPLGIGLAVNIRIGQLLGAKNAKLARRIVYIGAMMTVTEGVILNGLIALLRFEIPKLFTDDEEVINMCANILPLAALIAVFDAQCGMLNGVLRGCGAQFTGSLVMIFGLTAVGLPLALLLQFYFEFGIMGFYIGLALGVLSEFILLAICAARIDWVRMVYEAQLRAGIYEDYDDNKLEIDDEMAEDSLPKRTLSGSRLNLKFDGGPPQYLTDQQLLMRRGIFILIMLAPFVIGLAMRLKMQDELYSFDPCETNDIAINTTALSFIVTRTNLLF